MGSASCYGDPIQQVQAAIGRALRDKSDPAQPLPDRLAALAGEIEVTTQVVLDSSRKAQGFGEV
jgi:hypothetical protein